MADLGAIARLLSGPQKAQSAHSGGSAQVTRADSLIFPVRTATAGYIALPKLNLSTLPATLKIPLWAGGDVRVSDNSAIHKLTCQVVRSPGIPLADIRVCLYTRQSGQLIDMKRSKGDGRVTFENLLLRPQDSYFGVALANDDTPLTNSIIWDRILPTIDGFAPPPPIGPQQYWRLYITANNGDAYTSLQQWHCFVAGSSTQEQLSTSGQSSFFAGDVNTAARLTNGNLSDFQYTPWVSAAAVNLPHYVEQGFSTPKLITSINLYAQSYGGGPSRAPRDFLVQSSSDNVNWTNRLAVNSITGWVVGTSKSFDIPP